MQNMHPINAQYIIESLPKRLYHHMEWGSFEISTLSLPSDPEKGKRAMIGLAYNDFRSDVRVATYVLYEDGSIYMYDADTEQKLPYGIRYAHLQMLLSEYGLHGWNLNDSGSRKKLGKKMGVKLEEPAIAHQRDLSEKMKQVREAYAQLI